MFTGFLAPFHFSYIIGSRSVSFMFAQSTCNTGLGTDALME